MTRRSSRSSRATRTEKSSNGKQKTEGYVTLFEVKKDDDGNEYFQFVKNKDYVNIEVNGVNVNGRTFYINDPADKFELMVEKGTMSEDEADEKIARIPDYILEEGTIKLG
jgi:hypothetical protein